MKTIVTGGAGFIGGHLVNRLLSLGYYVTIVDNFSSGKKEFLKDNLGHKNLRIINEDLLNQQKIKKIFKGHNFVFHLASNPDIAKGIKDPSLDFKQGIMVTFNVLEAMRGNNIKKIFYPSGSGVYGDVGNIYTNENFSPLIPVSMYGASKLSAEVLISAFCYLFDMQAWILRPANIIGPHSTHGVVFDFIKKLKRNPKELEILGNGKQSKSYLYIDDVINAILLVISKSKEKINIFNIASSDFIDVSSIAKLVISGMNLKNVKLNYSGGKVGWKGDVPIVRIDAQKIKKIGWQPEYNSSQAVKKTIGELLKEKRCN